jgi:hypothetical protein
MDAAIERMGWDYFPDTCSYFMAPEGGEEPTTFTYPSYVPSCIVGHAIADVGVKPTVFAASGNADRVSAIMFRERGVADLTPEAEEAFRVAQAVQDGRPDDVVEYDERNAFNGEGRFIGGELRWLYDLCHNNRGWAFARDVAAFKLNRAPYYWKAEW